MKAFLSLCLILPLVGWAQDHAEKSGVVVKKMLQSTASWNGAMLPAYPEGQPEVTILRITIPPKTALPWHKHPVINSGVLLSGSLVVETEDGAEMTLSAGDPLVELVDTWHRGENRGDVPAVILVVYSGIKGEPITVLKDKP